jgi:hypothetical protein
MRYTVIPVLCCVLVSLDSCVNYRLHVQVLPPDTYGIKLDDEIDKGVTDSAGRADLTLANTSKAVSPKLSVGKGANGGYVVLDAYAPILAAKNLDTMSLDTSAVKGYRSYSLRFLVDEAQYREKHGLPAPLTAPRPLTVAESSTQRLPDPVVDISGNFSKPVHGPNDNIGYARKIVVTGTTCNFIGMGLNYATLFIPVGNSDGTTNDVGLVSALILGVASGPLQIAGTSYAVGGAKLAWELGEGKCDASNSSFDLWGYYKVGWGLTAADGVFGIMSGFFPKSSSGTVLAINLIGLGLRIARDVCWSTLNLKALTLTRKEKDCLGERKTSNRHLRMELEPYSIRDGGGVRCALLF